MLAFAVAGGWYGGKRHAAILLLGLPVAGAGVTGLLLLLRGGFQAARIRAMFHPSAFGNDVGYLSVQIRKAVSGLKQLGESSGGVSDKVFQNQWEDYAFLCIAQRYGLAVGILLLILLLVLAGTLLFRIGRQQNRLGAVTGVGCIFVFLLPVFIHILMNMGIFFNMSCSLPFVSMSGKQNISLYILMGLLLSIYRGSHIRPEPVSGSNRSAHCFSGSIRL